MCFCQSALGWWVPRSLQSHIALTGRCTTSLVLEFIRDQITSAEEEPHTPLLWIDVEDNVQAEIDGDTGAEVVDPS
jgi:hypothetical protein